MLAALLLEHQPAEVLHAKHGLLPATERLLRAMHGPAATAQDPARRGRPPFPSAADATQLLIAAAGWSEAGGGAPAAVLDAAQHAPLALRACAGLAEYLTELKVARQLLPTASWHALQLGAGGGRHMVIDAAALASLELIVSSDLADPASATLLRTLDRTVTRGGGELLRRWLCHPLRRADEIEARQAGMALLRGGALLPPTELAARLRKLSGLGPRLGRLWAVAAARRDLAARVSLPQKRVEELAKLLDELGHACVLLSELERANAALDDEMGAPRAAAAAAAAAAPLPPSHVARLLSAAGAEQVAAGLAELKRSAVKGSDGGLAPAPGSHEPYEQATARREAAEAALHRLLGEERRRAALPGIGWGSTGKFKWLFHVPAAAVARGVPADWERQSQASGQVRYKNAALDAAVGALQEAEAAVVEARDGALDAVFEHAARLLPGWRDLADALSELDALLSLSHAFADGCTPRLLWRGTADEPPLLELRRARHPILAVAAAAETRPAIPNDLAFGAGQPLALCLTGANMAGKVCRQGLEPGLADSS